MQIVGKQGVKVLRIVQKQIAEPLAPLLPDGDGGRENQAGRTDPADQLQTQDGFAAARRRDDVDVAVTQVFMSIVQYTQLVIAEGPTKTHLIKATHLGLQRRFFQCITKDAVLQQNPPASAFAEAGGSQLSQRYSTLSIR